MNMLRTAAEAIFGESDGTKIRRTAVKVIRLHAQVLAEFKAKAIKAGFTEPQVEVMAEYLSMSVHYHQYFNNGHWTPTTEPLTREAAVLEKS